MKAFPSRRGMTLLEMLLAMAIVGVVLLIIGQTINVMQNTWVRVRGKADGYRNTRLALDTVAQRISQATLNSRWTVDDSLADGFKYVTDSDLHFVCGPASDLLEDQAHTVGHAIFFQAPFGIDNPPGNGSSHIDKQKLNSTLNAWGYFVEYGPDTNERPDFMAGNADRFPERHRFRLLEFRQPAGELSLFNLASGDPPQLKLSNATSISQLYSWFREPLSFSHTYQQRHVTVVAENILALLITPLDPKLRDANSDLSTPAPYGIVKERVWDSRGFQLAGGNSTSASIDPQRHRMPPALQLTAIALSEDAWTAYTDSGSLDFVCQQLRSFVESRFHQGETLAADIAATAEMLDARRPRIPYRIITILVPLPEP